jgi:hypothetical protein
MLADELLFITSKEFCDVVRALKRMHPQYQHMALYAAQFWDDEHLRDCELSGNTPARDHDLPTGSHLKVVQ